jgi:CRISPR-associated protein Csh2
MPSKEGLKQGTFTEKYILPYSLIAFYGVVNENAAKDQNIPLSEEDVTLLLEALWNGTKNLLSGSKAGQMPRFLLQVEHKPGYSHFGELDKRIKFVSDKDDLALRGIRDGSLEIKDLQELFRKNQDEILKMRVKADDALTLTSDGKPVSVSEAFSGLPYEEITF